MHKNNCYKYLAFFYYLLFMMISFRKQWSSTSRVFGYSKFLWYFVVLISFNKKDFCQIAKIGDSNLVFSHVFLGSQHKKISKNLNLVKKLRVNLWIVPKH